MDTDLRPMSHEEAEAYVQGLSNADLADLLSHSFYRVGNRTWAALNEAARRLRLVEKVGPL